MLNPYVPGGTSAKKTKLPADPTNDYIDEGQRAGPLDQPMAKPTVTPTFASQPVAKPPVTSTTPPATQPAPSSGGGVIANLGSINPGGFQFTEDRLTNMLDSNSAYMRNARREGLDRAAERGGLNSSIAAGLSQREAIRAAAPIAQADAGFTQNRFMAGYNAQLEDTLAGNQMGRTMTRDSLLADLDSRRINQEADLQGQRDVRLSNLARIERQFDATLTEQARDNETSRAAWLNNQTVLSNQYAQAIGDQRRVGLDFLSSLGAAFIDDPEVYSPEVVSGMSNFFNQLAGGMSNPSIQQILRDLVGTAVPPSATQPVQPVTPAPGG